MKVSRARPSLLSLVAACAAGVSAAQDPFEPIFSGAMFHAAGIGSGGGDLVTADLDGDGHLDAVASYFESTYDTLKAFRGLGDGSLVPHWGLAVQVWSQTGFPRLALADLDGDGALDLAVGGSQQPMSITVMSGDGGGGFHQLRHVSVLGWPSHVVAADFDLDGNQDLVAGVRVGGVLPAPALCLLLGDGQGAFAPGKLLRLGLASQQLSDLRVGDVTSDGMLDLVAGLQEGPVVLVRNAGQGAFSTPERVETGVPALSLALRDLDGDAGEDLAVGIQDAILLLRGDGTGAFQQQGVVPMPMGQVPWRIDAVPLGSQRSMGLLVHEQHVAGGRYKFGLAHLEAGLAGGRIEEFPTGDTHSVITSGDLDEDGILDVLMRSGANWLLPALAVFYGGTEGGQRGVVSSVLAPPEPLNQIDYRLHLVEELDGDQVSDAVVGLEPTQLAIYAGRTDGRFERVQVLPLAPLADHDPGDAPVVAGDIDGDGTQDLAVAQAVVHFSAGGAACGEIALGFLRGLGGGEFASVDELFVDRFGRCGTDIDLVDLFGDGSEEVVLLRDGGLVSIAGADANAQLQLLYSVGLGRDGQIYGARDVDGDGCEEILLVLDGSASPRSLWAMGWNPVGGLETPVELLALPQEETALQLDDYDGDGWLDALIGEVQGHFHWDGSLRFWRGQAGGAFALAGVARTHSYTVPYPAADLDVDGASELIARLDGVLGGRLGVWRTSAAAALERQGEYLGAWSSTELADMDQDGFADLVFLYQDRLYTSFNLASGTH